MITVKPGQIWIDDKHVWDPGCTSDFVYIIKSREPGEGWETICFQNWNYGGYSRNGFTDAEINRMKFIGNLSGFKDPKTLIDQKSIPIDG